MCSKSPGHAARNGRTALRFLRAKRDDRREHEFAVALVLGRIRHGGLTGTLDDAAVYSSALSPATIRQHFVSGSIAPAMPGVEPDTTWGISQADVDRTTNLMSQAHAKWARVTASWSTLEPTTKGTYDNTQLTNTYDYALNKLAAAGVNVIIMPTEVPYWASADPNKYTDANGGKHWNRNWRPTNFQDYADFTKMLVNRSVQERPVQRACV